MAQDVPRGPLPALSACPDRPPWHNGPRHSALPLSAHPLSPGECPARLCPPRGRAGSAAHHARHASSRQGGARYSAVVASLSHPGAACTPAESRRAGSGEHRGAAPPAPRRGGLGRGGRWGRGGGAGGPGVVGWAHRPPALARAGHRSPPPARSAPPSWGAAQTRSLGRSKRCGSPGGSPIPPPLLGGPPPGIWLPTCRAPAHATPRSASGSI